MAGCSAERCGVLNRSPRLRSIYDTVNFTQLAWEVFFRKPARWGEIETPEQLLRLLLTIGKDDIRDERRRFDRKRCGCRLVSLDDERAQTAAECGLSPGDLLAFRERLETVLEGRTPLHRRIVELRQTHTCDEIAIIVGRSVGHVRRVLKKIREELAG